MEESYIAERFIAARRAMCREVFERGLARGELRPDIDINVAIDALYYRLLVSHANSGPGYADNLIEQLCPALAAYPSASPARLASCAASS